MKQRFKPGQEVVCALRISGKWLDHDTNKPKGGPKPNEIVTISEYDEDWTEP
jgi:hypothetical protein